MAKGLSPDKVRDYILKEDRELPEEEHTIFQYRVLSAKDYYEAQDQMVEFRNPTGTGKKEETRTIVHSGSHEAKVLVGGLVGVRNFRDEHGAEITLPEPRFREERMAFLSRLKPAWRREIAQAILGDSALDQADERD